MMKNLTVKLFADGASLAEIRTLYREPWINGFTTNPSLMRKDGVVDYSIFAAELVRSVPDRPLSFEVIADEFQEMERQALRISGWGENVYVKIPVTNTRGESSAPLIRRLAGQGVKQNITALMTLEQVKEAAEALAEGPSSYISVFAGRIADSGRDPVPIMEKALDVLRPYPRQELLWASSREVFNIIQANEIGCHIITVTNDLLRKLGNVGKDLTEFSLDTVKMFYDDASKSGYML